ncbi:Heterokaryon incompatibility Het-C [Fusarium oxysporum f. sp. vasinfectum]|nr:Heterokaryon incompatibility Het-C [Fusarium oxysporum f. sp. vasinfectum]KAK2939205.1 Heterokaryon incompatibility Het-C [Fusarium oxysporum f. sp. vasinfectum]WKT40851.1 Heterokaryon incompatibility Het-C [Fusarium oxysporum f. sp. vasinfectum]
MPSFSMPRGSWLLLIAVCLILLPGKAEAFGAGNIPSIAQVEGHNWRHGDIEDMLETIAFLHGKKWTSMLIKRTYFGNWLRDYSQAVDIGSLKGVNAETIRILVWVLSFMAHGYATGEFEVTADRLGVYRPEEHIDNPLGYGDGVDARTFDKRLRGPVEKIETEIDSRTGMKNYIANENGNWATSAAYLRYSFARSIHYGRLYTSGSKKGNEDDLCEALRCLGQALHTMEDFSAHSNYCELALRELGYHSVFPHCGAHTEIHLHGKRVYPLVTGTFGAVDFLHSVIGEASDHFTQSEVDEVDVALKNAEGFLGIKSSPSDFIGLVSKLPGVGDGFAAQARDLKASSEAQEQRNMSYQQTRGDLSRDNANQVPGMSPDFDPVETARKIYPILEFRDKIVKAISRGIAKVPGLEKLLEKISETLTAFILGLLAPFIRPIINQVSKVLKDGSSGVITASAKSQYEPWDNPQCSDPTHSMLSKDHFTNILNSCAGRIAATILQYTVPRVLYAWENTGVSVDEVVNDVLRAFHHPAARDDHIEIQRDMFKTVKKWADEHPRRHELAHLLSSDSVKNHKNHILNQVQGNSRSIGGGGCNHGTFGDMANAGHGKVAGSLWSQVKTRDLDSLEGKDGNPAAGYLSSSPAPPSQSSFEYGQNPNYAASNSGHSQQGGYGAPPPQPPYGGGYGGPPQPQYGAPPGQYGGPPPGQYGAPPPQQYGGPGYGAPQYPPYGQQGYGGPPPGQQPPGWGQYPGSRHGY